MDFDGVPHLPVALPALQTPILHLQAPGKMRHTLFTMKTAV
jgi:hypothetical protein